MEGCCRVVNCMSFLCFCVGWRIMFALQSQLTNSVRSLFSGKVYWTFACNRHHFRSARNRWCTSALFRWNISMYPSHTWLDKRPTRPPVSGLSSCPIPIWKSSYQTCQLLLKCVKIYDRMGFLVRKGLFNDLKSWSSLFRRFWVLIRGDLTQTLLIVWKLILLRAQLDLCGFFWDSWDCKI